MTEEQEQIIDIVSKSGDDEIYIKKTGLEEIHLADHSHGKCQIIYTLSGTLHVLSEGVNYFVPEKHVAWIPDDMPHKLSTNNRQASLINFYAPVNGGGRSFAIYNTDPMISENIRYLASMGPVIRMKENEGLFIFAKSFLNILPTLSPGKELVFKTLVLPEDRRLTPVLEYMSEHFCEDLKREKVAARFGLSVRNMSRLFMESGIRFTDYLNSLRVVRAIEMLTDGGKTMQQIAYELGYSTPANFNRVFRQVTGRVPGSYLCRRP